MHDRPTAGSILAKRLFLLAAILIVGAVVWFMMGESESVTAAETPDQQAPAEAAADHEVLARVNGAEITRQAVIDSIAGQLLKMDRDRHDLIARAVENEVRNALLEAEAEKRGLSREELVAAEVEARVSQVPAEEVDAFYEARKGQIRAPKEKVEGQIRRYLQYEGYLEGLEAGAEIDLLTEPFRVEVAAAGPKKGPDGAPVTIVEFSDFECPFCGRVNPSIDKIRQTYGDRVQIVFRQFPLEIHRNARKAGEASLCADEQGKFWQMHDSMFGDQKNLEVGGLKQIAARIDDLDTAAFDACLDSGQYAETVDKDLEDGVRAGVSSTPAFFINGRYLSGAQAYETLAEVIDDELERSSG